MDKCRVQLLFETPHLGETLGGPFSDAERCCTVPEANGFHGAVAQDCAEPLLEILVTLDQDATIAALNKERKQESSESVRRRRCTGHWRRGINFS